MASSCCSREPDPSIIDVLERKQTGNVLCFYEKKFN